MTSSAVPRWIAVAGAVFFAAFGLWAFLDPQSFFDEVAHWEPYNEHLFHDVGAFQIGLGAVLALAALGYPSLVVGLGGAAIGAVFHAISHFGDRDHGGKDSDPYVMAVVAIVLVVGAVLAWRQTSPSASRT